MNDLVKVIGKKGYITYKYNDRYIYSLYDPVNEAKKYINSLSKVNKYVITCCGLDYINSELLKNQNIKLIISFEPIDFNNSFSDKRLIRVDTIDQIEAVLLKYNIHAVDLSIIFWQPLIESIPEIFYDPIKKLKDKIYKSSISSNTLKAFGFLETKNILFNLRFNNNFQYIKISNINIDLPAVVISSGMSLSDNVDFINDVKNNSVLFALPSSLPFLYTKGIYPDYAIVVDPGYASYYHLIKYKKKLKLIGTLAINPNILKLKNYELILINYDNYFEKIFYKDNDIIYTPPEGTVFINLLRVIKQLGFKDVVLIGQDFGYKGGYTHVKEGSFEKEILSKSGYFNAFEGEMKKLEESSDKTEIIVGEKIIKTNFAFKLYYEHFKSKDFGLNLYITKNNINPLSDEVKQVDRNFIVKNFNIKNNLDDIIKKSEISNAEQKKNNIFSLIKKIYSQLINGIIDQEIENILIDSFIENNGKHINKLNKIIN